jgi:hypothetical protein
MAPATAWGQDATEQPDVEQTRQLFEHATQLYDASSFARAEGEFRQVWQRMEGHPRRVLVLVNIARSVESQPGREREALRIYEQVLEETIGTDDPPVQDGRRTAEARIEELRARLAALGSDRDQPSSTSPAPPGLTPVASGGVSPIGPILLGGGAAMLVAAAITGGLSIAQRGDVLARCEGSRCPPDAEGAAADIETLALATDVLWVAGAVVAAAGLVLTIVLRDEPESDVQVVAMCGPTGCRAQLSVSFSGR